MSDSTPPPPPPPPPGGGAPPPPPPSGLGGGGAPPPPMGGMPGPGGAAAPSYSVSDAFNYGWKKFQENIGPWILGVLILFVGLAVIQWVYQLIFSGLFVSTADTRIDPVTGQVELVNSGGLWLTLIGAVVLSIPLAILGMIVQAQIVRAGLGTTEGKIELGKFFETRLLGPVIIASIIAGLLTLLGVIACYVGAIIVAFFVQFFAYFVLDKEAKPWDSIKASFSFVNKHIANIIVLFLASAVAVFIGALLCGVGLLVAYPVVAIAHAYTYKVLNGEPVDPVRA